MSDNMFEEESSGGLRSIVKGVHVFGPLGEVIYCNNNMIVAIARGGLTFYEFDAPFAEWASGNDEV